ncbi:TetR/AcrR family transcriptional regulator [Leptospira sp. 'Mane']|uniref:TetR/AcrR family transcriptional regulator n=1 Tax=Leptospira sp. 'Mane' TaxID=3387407 RepID=UPI00398B7721
MKYKALPRREPKQLRSKERVQKILDTTIQLLQDVGYDSITTDAIASECGISVGSLYQFFPNKEAILYSLADISYLNIHDYFFSLVKEEMKTRKKFDEKLISQLLWMFEESILKVKWYHTIESIVHTHPELQKLDQKSNERFAKSLVKELLFPLFPKLKKQQAMDVAFISVESVDAVFKSLLRESKISKARKKQIIGELGRFLYSYFSQLK